MALFITQKCFGFNGSLKNNNSGVVPLGGSKSLLYTAVVLPLDHWAEVLQFSFSHSATGWRFSSCRSPTRPLGGGGSPAVVLPLGHWVAVLQLSFPHSATGWR